MKNPALAEAKEWAERKREDLPAALARLARMTPEELFVTNVCELCRHRYEPHPANVAGLAFLDLGYADPDTGGPQLLVAAEENEQYRLCGRCDIKVRLAVTAAIADAREQLPKVRPAWSAVLAIAENLERAIPRPAGRRRRRVLAQDFTIHVLHRLGVSDGELAPLVRIADYSGRKPGIGPRAKTDLEYRLNYVKDRRKHSVFRCSRWMRVFPPG